VKFWVPHWVVGIPVGPLSLISDPGRVLHTHVLHDTKQNEVPVNGRWRSCRWEAKSGILYGSFHMQIGCYHSCREHRQSIGLWYVFRAEPRVQL